MSERSAILQGRLQRETTEEFKVKILPISWLRKAKEELIGFSDTLTAFEKKNLYRRLYAGASGALLSAELHHCNRRPNEHENCGLFIQRQMRDRCIQGAGNQH